MKKANNKRILFIDPPHRPWDFFPGRVPSPGLLALVPVAVECGYEPVVCDLTLALEPVSALRRVVEEVGPALVAISGAKSAFAYETANTAALVRRLAPAALLLGGGNFVASYAEDLIGRGYFDVIATGEGEGVLRDVLHAVGVDGGDVVDVEAIAGIAYAQEYAKAGKGYRAKLKKQYGEYTPSTKAGLREKQGIFDREVVTAVRYSGMRPHVKVLDELPMPGFEYFDMDRYSVPPLGGRAGFVVSSSRGCGSRCSFCADSKFWGHEWRGFSAERTMEMLKVLKNGYGRNIIYLGDDDFLWDRERNLEFVERLEALKKADGTGVMLWIQSSVGKLLANKDILKRLRAAGVFQVMCGFESVSDKAQRAFDKRAKVERMEEAAAAVRKSGMVLMGMMMWGDWSDDAGTLEENLNFLVKNCDIIGPNTVVPHYGTRYFEECERRGLVDRFTVLGNDQCEVLMPTGAIADAREAERVYKEMVLKTLISKKKFIGNYLEAQNARVKKVLAELSSAGYRGWSHEVR